MRIEIEIFSISIVSKQTVQSIFNIAPAKQRVKKSAFSFANKNQNQQIDVINSFFPDSANNISGGFKCIGKNLSQAFNEKRKEEAETNE